MTRVYYCLVLLNAVVSCAAGVVVLWKNRYQAVGPALGTALIVVGGWLACFAQYFRPLGTTDALWWAHATLVGAVLIQPTLCHGLLAVTGERRLIRWVVPAAYLSALGFLLLLWQGQIITGLEQHVAYMDHYVHYNRRWYPLLGAHLLVWQVTAAGYMLHAALGAVGYRRAQLFYYSIAYFVVFLTAHIAIFPLEYEIQIPPFGFLLLPLNLVFLCYVLSRARLADFNVAIARLLLHSLTLMIVAGISLLFVAGMILIQPNFMNQEQILFTVMLVVVIGLVLAISLPRWLPRAERIMQERMFGKRYGYQDALASLIKELSRLPTIEEVLNTVAATVHSQMQVSRTLIFMMDPLAGTYKVEAESGLTARDLSELGELGEDSPLVHLLQENKDVLVRDELPHRVSAQVVQELSPDLDRLKASVCVPMLVDERLVGVMCVGEKINKDMFFISDLRLLENLGTEVALAVKYRRMEDQIFRKNRLIELGTIAAGVAHEIRNPLASIRTFAQLMPERMDDPEFKNEFSKLVMKDVDRITKVVESMLAFARPAQVQIAEHRATDLVEEAILLVQARLKNKRIELTRQFHEAPVLHVDKQQILQVLVNLLSNANDALPERGKIRVATGTRVMEETQDGNGSQRYGVIEVADNGPGVPVAVRNRLFDPFFTTKKEGTGLGLSISQKIVRDHGGIITVSSVEGKGTTFQVNLPLG